MRDVVRHGVVAEFGKQPTGQVVEQHGSVHVLPARGQVRARFVYERELGLVGQRVEPVEGHHRARRRIGLTRPRPTQQGFLH